MADKLLRATVTIPRVTGVPEDAIVNTWHFDGDDGNTDAAYHSAVNTMLTTFYQAVDTYLSDLVVTPARLKIYDMRDPTPRVPEFETDIALTIGAGTQVLPAEVAVALSYQAAPVSGQSQARRRGRIFLGPIKLGASVEATGDVRPDATMRGAIAAAADVLVDGLALAGTGSMKWALFSPTTRASGATLDDSFHDVASGWVDDAFDIIRKRGAKPTVRSTFAA
jgi:hypothetical protein